MNARIRAWLRRGRFRASQALIRWLDRRVLKTFAVQDAPDTMHLVAGRPITVLVNGDADRVTLRPGDQLSLKIAAVTPGGLAVPEPLTVLVRVQPTHKEGVCPEE